MKRPPYVIHICAYFISILGLLTLFMYSCKKDNVHTDDVNALREYILQHAPQISSDSLTYEFVDNALHNTYFKTSDVELIPAWNNWIQDNTYTMDGFCLQRNYYNTLDLLDFLSDYGTVSPWDLNDSGNINMVDLMLFLGNYGTQNSAGYYLTTYNTIDSIQWFYNDELIWTGTGLTFYSMFDDGWIPPHTGILNITARVYTPDGIVQRAGYSFFNPADPFYDTIPNYNESTTVTNMYSGPFYPNQFYID